MSNYSENNNLILGLAYFDKEAKDVVSFSDDMYLVGKLIPAEDVNLSALDSFSTSFTHGIMILPQYLMEGKYQFAFCLCDRNGNSYEWRHTIMVVSKT